MDESETRISNLEYKEEKIANQKSKKKKESKKTRIVSGAFGTTSRVPIFTS